jgi:hypothetical protein
MRSEPEKTVSSLKEAMDYIESDPPRPPSPAPSPSTLGEGGGEGNALRKQTPSPQPSPSVLGEGGQSLAKLESLAEEILRELRRQTEQAEPEFSVTKLLGGMVQVASVAIVFLAYLNRTDTHTLGGLLLFAIWLQCLTIGLMIMGRQR